MNKCYGVELNLSDLAYLKDFYFEARYPGDNFVEVTKEERNKCLDIVQDTIRKVKHLCSDVPEGLQKIQAF